MTVEQTDSVTEGPVSPWEEAFAEFRRVKRLPYKQDDFEQAFTRANSALGDRQDIDRATHFALGYDLASEAANFAEVNRDEKSANAYRWIAGAYDDLQHEYATPDNS